MVSVGPRYTSGHFADSEYSAYLRRDWRADERTEPLSCSLRVIIHVLKGFAQGKESPLDIGAFLALGCTVLRSRWCQSGINRSPWLTRGRFLCKPDAPVGLRKSTPLGRLLEDATSKPRGYRLNQATTPLISAQLLEAPRAAQPSPTTFCADRPGALRERLTI